MIVGCLYIKNAWNSPFPSLQNNGLFKKMYHRCIPIKTGDFPISFLSFQPGTSFRAEPTSSGTASSGSQRAAKNAFEDTKRIEKTLSDPGPVGQPLDTLDTLGSLGRIGNP